MCFLKALKSFGKRDLLNLWELVSLGSIKTHFGKSALEYWVSRHEKIIILANIVLLLLIPLRFRHTRYLKMTVWTSVLWKILMQLAEKWPEMVIKLPFMNLKLSVFFLTKLKKNWIGKICILYLSFWFNWDLDKFGSSKWPLEPKFCERCSCSWQKNDQKCW